MGEALPAAIVAPIGLAGLALAGVLSAAVALMFFGLGLWSRRR
ncbi:hypothetical protein [Aeropyrum camini]|nr:hypothetical protein [Aeropyrum camini]